MKEKKVKARRSQGSKLFRLAVIGFAVYSGVSIVSLQTQVQRRRQELNEYDQLCYEQYLANKELELQISVGNDPEYIERTARERLDYVYPYETVYINASGS